MVQASLGEVFYGWRVVAACFVIAAVAWGLGLFGSSVYLQAVTDAHGWAIGDVSAAITVFFLVSACVQRLVGQSINRLGPRPVLLASAISMALGVALIGQATRPWQLYPCFILIGLGWSALSTTGLAATVAPWFERHQGRSMTLAIMGASVGAIAGVPLLLAAIGTFGLALGLIGVALVAIAVLVPLIAIVLRYRDPADIGLGRDGDRLPSMSAALAKMDSSLVRDANASPHLLWTATAAFALGLTIQIGFITHHVALAKTMLDTASAGLLVSATGATAFLGRLVLAAIVDRINPRFLAAAILLIQAAVLAAMSRWPSTEMLVMASLIYGYGIGHVTTLGPIVVRREFGAKAFGQTYGTAATVIQLTSALGPAFFGILRDFFDGYGVGLRIAAATLVTGSILLMLGARSRLPRS